MPYLTKYGEYFIHHKVAENTWTIKYLGCNKEKTNTNIPYRIHRYPGTDDIVITDLLAIDVISAFTRGANAIIDKIEEKP